MKNSSKIKAIHRLIVITGFLFLSIGAISQPPPPPADPGTGGNAPVGASGAPVGSGTLLLIGLAGLYAARKLYIHNTEDSD